MAGPGTPTRICSTCGFENPPGVRFCGQCGAVLFRSCPACGAENPSRNRFCGQCGGPMAKTLDVPGTALEDLIEIVKESTSDLSLEDLIEIAGEGRQTTEASPEDRIEVDGEVSGQEMRADDRVEVAPADMERPSGEGTPGLLVCKVCGTDNPSTAVHCELCGAVVAPAGAPCSACGFLNRAGSLFCDNCGERLGLADVM